MKVLIVGATGTIGTEVLNQCLAHPDVTSVVTFLRRKLPTDISVNTKLECIIVTDFKQWPEDVLRSHTDAVAMIWAMGSYDGNPAVDLEYPLAFQEAYVKALERCPDRPRFRYIHLSGRLSEQDQNKALYLLDKPRMIKGLHETRAITFAKEHSALLQTFIVRPGGVLSKGMVGTGVLCAFIGKNWVIQVEELGAYITYLAVGGEEGGSVIDNARMVEKGREFLSAKLSVGIDVYADQTTLAHIPNEPKPKYMAIVIMYLSSLRPTKELV